MSQYFVTLDEGRGVSLFAVCADSPVTAAEKVSEQAEHGPGRAYSVEPMDRSESPQEIAVGDDR